jgi:hypothetical protein
MGFNWILFDFFEIGKYANIQFVLSSSQLITITFFKKKSSKNWYAFARDILAIIDPRPVMFI